jgi:phosphoglycerate dehydrogenase-like enzyme
MKSLAIASRSFSQNPILRKEVLRHYPDAKFNDEGLSLHGDSLINFLNGYERAITALEVIDENILSNLPDLKVIGKYGVGLDMIDLYAMNRNGVKLGWTGGVNKRSVSELVISFSIYLLHRIVLANSKVRDGEWFQVKGRQLSECTVGIIGCGFVGKDLVKLLKPFNCNIFVHDIKDYRDFYIENNITPLGLDELIEKSDVISLHLPLDESTKNILDKRRLKKIKKNAIIINLARGGLIDEEVLKKLLIDNKIAGAALDVFATEPPKDREFALMENVLITPHIGGSTEEAILAMGMAAIRGLKNSKDALSFLPK